jgi:predicted phage baseplate assembly protein
MPDAGMTFTATYRRGNGKAGNVGAETLQYIVTRDLRSGSTMKPRNPMAARGGLEREPISEVKMFAPGAFKKTIERAITAEDYALLAQRNPNPDKPKVQLASAQLRWTGSWHEARVDIDPFGAEELSDKLRNERKGYLYPYRRIGHDLSVAEARYVSLDIALEILVAPRYLRGHVESALRDVLSDRVLENGRSGFFHADNLTFGGGIYLSALVAAAQAVDGVTACAVTKLQRLFESANDEIENGVLPLGKNEIARLDNDPNFPEHGRLKLNLQGGR